MKKKHNKFWSKKQSLGLLFLFLIILLLQLLWFFRNHLLSEQDTVVLPSEWLVWQNNIDSLKVLQAQKQDTIYAFNPNYINDYRGLQLGLSVETLDKVYGYRATGKFMNSLSEFQKVTQLPDSVIKKITPYLRFPNFNYAVYPEKQNSKIKQNTAFFSEISDFNKATQEDFKRIKGIGDGIAERIIQRRNSFGGFLHMDQIDDIWGLSPELIKSIKSYFAILEPPVVTKLKINVLSSKDLAKFPYFNFELAKNIVTYRTMNQGIKSVDDLTKIKGFPIEKLEIITLYLEF
jgi:DNA uptake protein ComE-like DNA-binding protein